MPDGRESALFVHDSQAVLTAGIEPSPRRRLATSSATGSQTEKGSVTVSVAAREPLEDHDHAWDTFVTPTRPSAAPSVMARLLLRFPIHLPTFEVGRTFPCVAVGRGRNGQAGAATRLSTDVISD